MPRVILVLCALLAVAADPSARPTASAVSLDARNMPLGNAARELGRQANVAIDVERAERDKQITLRLSNVPFWTAMERLAEASNHRLAIGPQGQSVALSREPYRSTPSFVNGAFRTAARKVVSRLDFEVGISQHEVQLDIAWEPKFKAYYVELDPASLVAFDGQGQRLTIANEGSTRIPIGSETPQISIKLRNIPRREEKIARLEGVAKFLGTTQMLTFSFDLAAKTKPQSRAEVSANLIEMRKNVNLWTAVVELEYPRDMPEFESFQSFLLDNEAWLLRSDGTKFPVKKFELGNNQRGKLSITYYIKESEKEGVVLGDKRGWKLAVRVPGRIVEERVEFRLKDIRLP